MKTELERYELLSEVSPSDLFVSSYGGNFAQRLVLDWGQVETFLDIASLDGRVLLQESKVHPVPSYDGVNPDGSVTGRGSLRWEEKLQFENPKQNPYFQVDPDPNGWVISINGNLITDDLMRKSGGNAREVERKFATKFNWYLSVGLREAALKDHFKLPDLLGSSLLVLADVTLVRFIYGEIYLPFLVCTNLFANYMINSTSPNRDKYKNFFMRIVRKTDKSKIDHLGLPLEIDRLILAYGYRDLKKYTGNPLVQVAD